MIMLNRQMARDLYDDLVEHGSHSSRKMYFRWYEQERTRTSESGEQITVM